jgi:hypothetical protein
MSQMIKRRGRASQLIERQFLAVPRFAWNFGSRICLQPQHQGDPTHIAFAAEMPESHFCLKLPGRLPVDELLVDSEERPWFMDQRFSDRAARLGVGSAFN